MKTKQLECRIVITRSRSDCKTEIGMYDPISMRYEPLGEHGPDSREVEKVILDLKKSMEKAGHIVSFSDLDKR